VPVFFFSFYIMILPNCVVLDYNTKFLMVHKFNWMIFSECVRYWYINLTG